MLSPTLHRSQPAGQSPFGRRTGSGPGTLIVSRREVAALLTLEDCIAAIESALFAHAEGKTIPPGVLSAHVQGGGFHIKAAGRLSGRPYFAAKLNGNFYANAERFGLPRIQGLLVLSDADDGSPLAVMDSTEITVVRTGAATAVAAKHLSRSDSRTMTLCGCGLQGRIQLAAILQVRPIQHVYLYDADPSAASLLAADVAGLEVEVLSPGELSRGTRRSDICVTCTPSREPLLGKDDILPGTFIAAVGADSEEKQELDPGLLAASKVVVDHLEQCATIGELHHALSRKLLTRADVHAELHEVVSGHKPGRESHSETIVYDSTGVALQDVAAAVVVYERAMERGAGVVFEFRN